MSAWKDIKLQVENLQNVVEYHAAARPEIEQAAGLLQTVDRIIFTGVGSGMNATIPAVYYLMENGRPAQYIDTTEAVYGMLPGLRGAAIVLNTRSGETVELIKLAQMARRAGITLIAVTNETDSTVAKLANVSIPTHSRWDDLVVLSAFGGMLATELILVSQIVGKVDEMLQQLQAAADAIPDTLAQAVAKRQETLDIFRDARPIYLLGRNASLASALGGQLVLEEMSRRPAIAMATGLFRQGPLEVVDERFRAVMFSGIGMQAHLAATLGKELVAKGAKILWVGPESLPEAHEIQLPALPAYTLPLLEIVPCHVLAYDLALSSSIEPGTVRYIQKVITTEEGLPNQDNQAQ